MLRPPIIRLHTTQFLIIRLRTAQLQITQLQTTPLHLTRLLMTRLQTTRLQTTQLRPPFRYRLSLTIHQQLVAILLLRLLRNCKHYPFILQLRAIHLQFLKPRQHRTPILQ